MLTMVSGYPWCWHFKYHIDLIISRPFNKSVQRGQHKNVVFLVSSHDGDKKFGRFPKKNGFRAKKLHFWPEILHFFTLHLWNPHFFGSDAPDRTDHMSPISWGNSGYLWFSGRWSFGRSAGRFLAPTAQSGPFWAKKWVFWPEINFLSTSSNFFVTIMTRHQKDNVFVSLMLLNELLGGCKSPFLAQK